MTAKICTVKFNDLQRSGTAFHGYQFTTKIRVKTIVTSVPDPGIWSNFLF